VLPNKVKIEFLPRHYFSQRTPGKVGLIYEMSLMTCVDVTRLLENTSRREYILLQLKISLFVQNLSSVCAEILFFGFRKYKNIHFIALFPVFHILGYLRCADLVAEWPTVVVTQ
jgi:hypothetical protein